MDEQIRIQREFLKDSVRKITDFSTTDQHQGVPPPPIEKPFDPAASRVQLLARAQWEDCITQPDLVSAIANRESRREFSSSWLSLAELSFLLWATQGVRRIVRNHVSLRTVPSAGARHSFETYVFANRVQGIETGLHRYLPVENELLMLNPIQDMEAALTHACMGQGFVGDSAATFAWTTIPYRMEWRYSVAAHRVILIDVGHVCQNLYLACEAIRAGTCAVGAYDQQAVDALLGVDGENEFTVYLAPVGKLAG